MTAEDLAKMIEGSLTDDDRAALEKMSDAEQKEFSDFIVEHVKKQAALAKAKADELTRLAKAEGVNVDGSKGMQFLIGCIAGLQVRIDDLDKQVAEHNGFIAPKLIAKAWTDGWKKRVAEKEKTP